MNIVTVREYQSIAIGTAFTPGDNPAILPIQADRLLAFSERLKGGKKTLEPFKLANRTTIKTQQFVGLVQFSDFAVEIIPKIDGLNEDDTRLNLLRMLACTNRLKITEAEIASLRTQRLSILEIFIRFYCDGLFSEVHKGLCSSYERRTGNLSVLRGKLQTGQQATLNAFHPERFHCEYDEFTVDIPLNRVLKAAVSLLRRLTRNLQNGRRLMELEFVLDGVSDVSVHSLDWHRLHFDRGTRRYEPLVRMARFILQHLTQDVTSGNSEGIGLLFDMNELFEEFIGAIAKKTFVPDGWQVAVQGPVKNLLKTKEGQDEHFRTKPDITGLKNSIPCWIMDTKWKRLDDTDKKLKVSQADVYQMLGYARRYGVESVMLLYPYHAELDKNPGVMRTYHMLNHYNTDESLSPPQFIYIATVSLDKLETTGKQLHKILSDAVHGTDKIAHLY